MILAAVGKNASGKDYFLDIISKQFDIPVISFGDCARELATKEGLEHTRENLHHQPKRKLPVPHLDKKIKLIKEMNVVKLLYTWQLFEEM